MLRRGLIILIVAAVAAALGYIALARTRSLAADDTLVRRLYVMPPTAFITVDDVLIRIRDEGQGPPIVLLHAGRNSLEDWDGWVEALRDTHRLIRLDLPPFGLSGPDPTGRYDGDRAAELVHLTAIKLGVLQYAVAGMSSGSTVALRLVTKYPKAVTSLILASVPVTPPPPTPQPPLLAAVTWVSDTLLGGYRPELYWREQLRLTFGDDARITDQMIRRQWALNSIPGRSELADRYVAANRDSGFDYVASAAGVRVPVLVQWGGSTPILAPEKANEVAAMFTASPSVQVKIYPSAGHYLYLELPDDTARDAAAFLAAAKINGEINGVRLD